MAAKGKAAKGAAKGNARPMVIIRREEVVSGKHHGGAWKVAYADFVTAMMAFFLLMWLINATTEAQRIGLADYFSQANVLNRGASGEGKPFGGSDPFDTGALASNLGTVQIMPGKRQPQSVHPPLPTPGASDPLVTKPALNHVLNSAMQQADHKAEQAAFQAAAQKMHAVIDADKNLKPYADQISITVTPQGIQIQIIDSHNQPMFAIGSAEPAKATQIILNKIAPVLAKLAHPINIAGYTDARPYADPAQSNWLLSVERANATREILVSGGLPETELTQVAGYADRQLLHPNDPLAAANRRITITVTKGPTPAFSGPPAASPQPATPLPATP
jgi:chemotaxis protein MotB